MSAWPARFRRPLVLPSRALTRADVDAERIAAWGDSYSGMIALAVGALDRRYAAVAVQCPAYLTLRLRPRAKSARPLRCPAVASAPSKMRAYAITMHRLSLWGHRCDGGNSSDGLGRLR